jgi:hypothetical protein
MLSSSESDNFCTLESQMEKAKKEKDQKTLKILDPYIEKLNILTNDIKKKDNLLLYYNLKINKIKDEYDELIKEINDEENTLIETYISFIEKEEFYLSPSNLEIKDLAERARERKLKYSKLKNDYDYDKLYLDKKEQELEDKIDKLPKDERNLYLILKEHILNDKDLNKVRDDLELLSDDKDNNNNINEIILKNKPFLREAKDKMRDRKKELNDIRNEIKFNNDKKAQKSMNHLNFNNNMSIIKTHSVYNSNNNSMLDNNNSFLFNGDLDRSNDDDMNNRITNLNKTYYLRTNKPYHNNNRNKPINRNLYFQNLGNNTINNGSNNNFKIKSYSNFLNTDSSDKWSVNHKHGKRNVCYCKKLLKNYCNKYSDSNNDFMADLKMTKKKNQSVPKSLYEQRRIIRENMDDYIYINGNRYKQSLIGKATDTLNGVY